MKHGGCATGNCFRAVSTYPKLTSQSDHLVGAGQAPAEKLGIGDIEDSFDSLV
jgi:hypothetical protein